jgi:two-component system, OmpR family, copper resistance phosphate regulon response regulator CusR
MRVLIVEDEGLIARFVARGLQAEGYTTSVAPDGEMACRRLREEEWDLAILDLLLPARSGFDVLGELSLAANQVPVLVLSARRSVEDKVAALDAGATDFLAKPFALDELLARVRALLRRGRSPAETEPRGEADLLVFTLDGRSRTLCWGDGRTLSLSEREFGLLEYLVRSPNQTVSRERILNAVWEYQFDPRSNVVDVYVGRLRRKLHPAIRIETVRGGGYRLMTG